jgi:hypothetical protein
MIMGGTQAAASGDTQKANQDSKAQLEQDAEEKKQASALKGFEKALQELP